MSALGFSGATVSSCLMRWLALALLIAAACAAALVRAPTWLVFNPSHSVPSGFYLRIDGAPEVGTYVTVRARDVAPAYARLRAFDDRSDRFIKRVAAGPGTIVCATGTIVTLDGVVLDRAVVDGAGRALPSWRGCHALADDEIFLLGDSADSFDSRYWGPVRVQTIEAVWRPLFVRPSSEDG